MLATQLHDRFAKALTDGDLSPIETELFEITGGAVVPLQPVRTTFRVLGCAITSGGTPCYVTSYITIDGKTETPWGNPNNPRAGNINDGQQHSFDAGILEAGKEIGVTGRSFLPNRQLYLTKSSNPASQNVLVLRNGDSVGVARSSAAAVAQQHKVGGDLLQVAPGADIEYGTYEFSTRTFTPGQNGPGVAAFRAFARRFYPTTAD